MSDSEVNFDTNFLRTVNVATNLNSDRLLPGSTGIAFDQGRAAAIQGLNEDECPYTLKYEPRRFVAWNKGFGSYNRTTVTRE